ncbi:MAG: peptidase, partial [Magnetococcales bacterium]|nr:peptidase [Magnetococcales bacterium]
MLFFGAGIVTAGDTRHLDHEVARRLVQSGEILPLERIIDHDRVRGRDLLEVELKKKHGVHIYEVEVVDARGEVKEFRFDAKTGQMLSEKTE